MIELRKKVQKYAKQGMKKMKIAQLLGVSRKFVGEWYDTEKNPEKDERGWKKGKLRKFTKEQEENVIKIRKKREPHFFLEPKPYNKNWEKNIAKILLTGHSRKMA